MLCDVTVVMFRTPKLLVERLLQSLGGQEASIGTVWILHSGCTDVSSCEHRDLGRSCRLRVEIRCRPDNLGFAGGHNYLISLALRGPAQYVFLANPDLSLSNPECLADLIAQASECGRVPSSHGPVLILGHGEDEIERIDSAGIRWSRSRRHFDDRQGRSVDWTIESTRSVDGVTGAALLLSRETISTLLWASGYVFDPLFIAYREDAELGRRISALNGINLIHPVPGFRHDRGSRNAVRQGDLARRFGVQNRFLIKYRFRGTNGRSADVPGRVRDLIVALACLTLERQTLPGLRQAKQIKRTERYRGERVRAVARSLRGR